MSDHKYILVRGETIDNDCIVDEVIATGLNKDGLSKEQAEYLIKHDSGVYRDGPNGTKLYECERLFPTTFAPEPVEKWEREGTFRTPENGEDYEDLETGMPTREDAIFAQEFRENPENWRWILRRVTEETVPGEER